MMGLRHLTLLPSHSAATQAGREAVVNPASPVRVRGSDGWRKHELFWRIVAHGAHPGEPGGLLTGWWVWEQIAKRLWPTFVPPDSSYGLLRIRISKFHGRPVDLADSIHIKRGALICEVHCDNSALLAFASQNIDVYEAGRSELTALANWVIRSKIHVEALYGVTLLGAAAARLGFYRRAMSAARRARADRLYMNGLLALYSHDGVSRLERGRTLQALPQEIWMSRAELLRRYGPNAPIRSITALRPDIASRSGLTSPNAKTTGS
jgi:hypothetical protein